MFEIPKNKKVILFDGVCNLCNSSIQKIIQLDVNNTFMFAANQSEIGQKIIHYLKIDPALTDSVILYEPGFSYDVKSTAALKIMNTFGGIWVITKLCWIFPESFRDLVYDFIAKNRYKWFGKKENCMVPNITLKDKFLE